MALDRSFGPRCNIGPLEVARRRRSAIAFTAVAAVVALWLVAIDVPPVARLALFPFAAGAAVNWAQVLHRFCVAFGLFGIENFGRPGEEHRVDAAQRAADRRRVAQLVLEGSVIGATITLALMLSPICPAPVGLPARRRRRCDSIARCPSSPESNSRRHACPTASG